MRLESPKPKESIKPMRLAFNEAEKAFALGEVPVGAVILYEGKVIATAHNEILMTKDPTAHAEIVAIRRAAKILGSERLIGCDLVVTLEPCAMCAGAISLARIKRLYYGASDEKGGAVENGTRFFNNATCHHAPEVYNGFMETDSAALLREFFRGKR